MKNPFELVTSSKLSANQAIELWCDDNRLERVRGGESCFINGNRGTGKSMLFRVLQRDCQELMFPEQRPSFLSVYFSVRDSDLMIEEFTLMQEQDQSSTLAESHLALLIVRQLLVEILKTPQIIPDSDKDQFQDLLVSNIEAAYEFSEDSAPGGLTGRFQDVISRSIRVLDRECNRLVNFVLRRLYATDLGYGGPLFFFDGLLSPIADFLMDRISCKLYILIDDADDLPRSHTVVLNSWISRRRRSVAFKVSTMYNYKTYETRSGSKIQQPHDFIQYDIANRFLEDRSQDYIDLVHRICVKRLRQCRFEDHVGSVVDIDEFFPSDRKQDVKLGELRIDLLKRYERKYSGREVGDYVYRHLSSEYMKNLTKARSSDSYRYAGFRTLAILSGGLVRDFIICAQRMWDNASHGVQNATVVSIPSEIQDRVVRDHADAILAEIDDARQKRTGSESDWRAVSNMVRGLGATFKRKMLSNDSERRVFSFAFQSRPEPDLVRLLDLAVSEGYLIRGFISEKEGFGRRYLYVLTRRIGPAFGLDVSAYSGYLSLMPSAILGVMRDGLPIQSRASNERQLELPFGSLGLDGDWMIGSPDGRDTW